MMSTARTEDVLSQWLIVFAWSTPNCYNKLSCVRVECMQETLSLAKTFIITVNTKPTNCLSSIVLYIFAEFKKKAFGVWDLIVYLYLQIEEYIIFHESKKCGQPFYF